MKAIIGAVLLSLAAVTLAEDLPVVEMFDPNRPHSETVDYISNASGKGKRLGKVKVLVVTFGLEDAAPARELGQALARNEYTSGQAEAETWHAAWTKYPNDRFFARCYQQMAYDAYTIAAAGVRQ